MRKEHIEQLIEAILSKSPVENLGDLLAEKEPEDIETELALLLHALSMCLEYENGTYYLLENGTLNLQGRNRELMHYFETMLIELSTHPPQEAAKIAQKMRRTRNNTLTIISHVRNIFIQLDKKNGSRMIRREGTVQKKSIEGKQSMAFAHPELNTLRYKAIRRVLELCSIHMIPWPNVHYDPETRQLTSFSLDNTKRKRGSVELTTAEHFLFIHFLKSSAKIITISEYMELFNEKDREKAEINFSRKMEKLEKKLAEIGLDDTLLVKNIDGVGFVLRSEQSVSRGEVLRMICNLLNDLLEFPHGIRYSVEKMLLTNPEGEEKALTPQLSQILLHLSSHENRNNTIEEMAPFFSSNSNVAKQVHDIRTTFRDLSNNQWPEVPSKSHLASKRNPKGYNAYSTRLPEHYDEHKNTRKTINELLHIFFQLSDTIPNLYYDLRTNKVSYFQGGEEESTELFQLEHILFMNLILRPNQLIPMEEAITFIEQPGKVVKDPRASFQDTLMSIRNRLKKIGVEDPSKYIMAVSRTSGTQYFVFSPHRIKDLPQKDRVSVTPNIIYVYSLGAYIDVKAEKVLFLSDKEKVAGTFFAHNPHLPRKASNLASMMDGKDPRNVASNLLSVMKRKAKELEMSELVEYFS